jgi:hypothetical protein
MLWMFGHTYSSTGAEMSGFFTYKVQQPPNRTVPVDKHPVQENFFFLDRFITVVFGCLVTG